MGLYLGHTGPYKIGKKYKLYIGRKNQGHVHDFVLEQTVNATCTTEGYLLYRCSCNVTSKDIIPALGHTDLEYTDLQDGFHVENCAECGERVSTPEPHTYDENGVCVCGAVKESVCVHEWSVTNTTWSANHDSCTAFVRCNRCGYTNVFDSPNISTRDRNSNDYPQNCTTYVQYEHVAYFIEAIPEQACPDWHEDTSRLTVEHDLYTPEGKFKGNAPTCNFNGSTPYYECRNCDYVQLPQSLPADPDAHNFIDGVCTNCGYVCEHTDINDEYKVCNKCGMTVCEHSNITDCYCSDCGAPFHEWATADECVCIKCEETFHDWITIGESPVKCTRNGYTGDVVCSKCGAYHPELGQGEIIYCRGYHIEDENDSGVCKDCGYDGGEEPFEGDMNDV